LLGVAIAIDVVETVRTRESEESLPTAINLIHQESTFVSGTPVAPGANVPWTATSGAWFPVKNAVSTSQPMTIPLPTPSLITTQSPLGESL
jgi:hypothetical protein